jgi:plastocyanin
MALAVVLGVAPGAAWGADHPVSFPTGAAAGPYSPSQVEAGVGDTVTFSGAFGSHPLVWTNGDFGTQGSGSTGQFTFTKPGTFAFHCQIHPSMTGSVHVAGNQFATPDFTWAPASPRAGQAVTFTPTGFTDPNGSVVRYEWDLDGDGSFESFGGSPSHTYPGGGTVTVRLRYVDDGHETSPATAKAVTVAGPPTGGGGGGGSPAPGQPGGGGSQNPPSAGGGGGANPPSSAGGDSQPSAGGGQGAHGDDAIEPGIRVMTGALAFHRGKVTITLRLATAGTARLTIKRGRTTWATGAASGLRAGTRKVTVTLTKAGAAALRRARGSVKATLTATLKPRAGGDAPSTTRRTVRCTARAG